MCRRVSRVGGMRGVSRTCRFHRYRRSSQSNRRHIPRTCNTPSTRSSPNILSTSKAHKRHSPHKIQPSCQKTKTHLTITRRTIDKPPTPGSPGLPAPTTSSRATRWRSSARARARPCSGHGRSPKTPTTYLSRSSLLHACAHGPRCTRPLRRRRTPHRQTGASSTPSSPPSSAAAARACE